MARNYALDPAHRDDRRRHVEGLKIRGLSNREIVKALGKAGYTNPATGEPYGRDVINRDVLWLRGEWAKRHGEEIDEHVALQLAEIREGKRVAWGRGDITEVRLYLKREAELLGLDAPRERRLAGPLGGPVPLQVEAVARPPTEGQQIREIDEHLAELDAERRQLEAELASLQEDDGDDAAP